MANTKNFGVLGTPKGPMELEIAEHLAPLLTEEDKKRIKEKKLTLEGCIEECMKKGHKFETKTKKSGIARISPEQHWKWVCGYFGVKFTMPGEPVVKSDVSVKAEIVTDDSLDSLLNF